MTNRRLIYILCGFFAFLFFGFLLLLITAQSGAPPFGKLMRDGYYPYMDKRLKHINTGQYPATMDPILTKGYEQLYNMVITLKFHSIF